MNKKTKEEFTIPSLLLTLTEREIWDGDERGKPPSLHLQAIRPLLQGKQNYQSLTFIEKAEPRTKKSWFRQSFRQNILEGPSAFFYPEGILRQLRFYQEGRLHGPSYTFGRDGTLRYRTFFIEGAEEGVREGWDRAAMKILEERMNKGKREGSCHFSSPQGQLLSSLHYTQSLLEGVATFFHENGRQRRKLSFRLGKKEGEELYFFPSGKLESIGYFTKGQPCQQFLLYHTSGALRERRIFHGSPQKYDLFCWDRSSNLVIEAIYRGDEFFYREEVEGEGLTLKAHGHWDGNRLLLDDKLH